MRRTPVFKWCRMLPAFALFGCGGAASDGANTDEPSTLFVDGTRMEVDEDTEAVEVPFLQSSIRLESDASSIEVSGSDGPAVPFDAEEGSAIEIPLVVGENLLDVTLQGDTEVLEISLRVTRRDFQSTTYIKAEEPSVAGLFGSHLDARSHRICAREALGDQDRISVYVRGPDGFALEQDFLVEFPSGSRTTCTLAGDFLALVNPGVRLFEIDSGEFREVAVLLEGEHPIHVSGSDDYLFVAREEARELLVFSMRQWDAPEVTLHQPEADMAFAFGDVMAALEDLVLVGGHAYPLDDMSSARLYAARKIEGLWSLEEVAPELAPEQTLSTELFALAPGGSAYVVASTSGGDVVLRLDRGQTGWDVAGSLDTLSSGEALRVFSLEAHRDLLFVGIDDNGAGEGINPEFGGDAPMSGGVAVFESRSDDLEEVAYLKATYHPGRDGSGEEFRIGEAFGSQLSVGEDFLVVAAISDSSGNGGVGADPADTSASASGALWVFE